MDMRSPLGKVLGLGSAKDGTTHFWHQRLTSIAILPFVIFFMAFMLIYSNASYDEVVSVLSDPFVFIIMVLGLGTVFFHMKLGMQVIIEDYIHSKLLRYSLIIMNTFFVFLMTAFSFFCLIKILFMR
ncbi:Succinate dehydrogenase hydrophobic membrane anchor protein [Liberibacter crescens BT-1]|uniref:Succinate dehydrogenase hydrophobic membrane anchor subunit n=1 Tax=Liberibacter crescens (strain BT-1) TaxID=1215343 RepID=L0EUV4_LIBCB|nr:succinate dehydrogenase, hydrophobic membrane anchor protein [Liberibacter crescens]AGA64742.1 Succinate dehydrogenase hydrophobic membrane anchor protein [Liberibacter crescens BT-1]AMC12824.1 succinate dehydrogenase [Liberibacter crescens]